MNLADKVENPYGAEWQGMFAGDSVRYIAFNEAISACQKVYDEEIKRLFEKLEYEAWYRSVDVGMGKHHRTSNCLCFTFDDWQALKSGENK